VALGAKPGVMGSRLVGQHGVMMGTSDGLGSEKRESMYLLEFWHFRALSLREHHRLKRDKRMGSQLSYVTASPSDCRGSGSLVWCHHVSFQYW